MNIRPAIATLALLPCLAWGAPDVRLQMTVDTAVPAPRQTVEFRIVVSNAGPDAATDLVVSDRLPDGLAIPAGLAAFPSAGSYDPATGAWTVGTLNPAASATLVIPAIVVAQDQPPCLANVATAGAARATAVVRRDANARCADLAVAISADTVPPCVIYNQAANIVRVTNLGPDEARAVLVDVSQDPSVIPALTLTGGDCSGTRCAIATLPPGAARDLLITSARFRNGSQLTVALTAAASSADIDYATSNNQSTILQTYRAVTPICDGDINEGWRVSGSCFIATAAFGSPLEPHVQALREFRDRHLRRSSLGRAFIRLYERYSPPAAAVIARHQSLRLAARAALTPLVLAVEYPRRALGLALLAALAGASALLLRRRRAVATQSDALSPP